MASSESKYRLAAKFTNTSRDEFNRFKGDLKSLLQLHPRKLHTVLFEGKLHSSVQRTLAKEMKEETLTDDEARLRTTEFMAECNEEAFAILDLNLADATLQKRIRRDFSDDGRSAWEYIESLHVVKDRDTRVTRAADQRRELIDKGLTGGALATVKQFCEELEAFNVELDGTPHHFTGALMTTTLLDALSVHHDAMVSTFKTMHSTTSHWRDDFPKVRDALYELIEEADRVQGKTAQHQERLAMHTRIRTDEVAELRSEVAKLTALLASQVDTQNDTRNVLRTSTRARCDECDKVHSMVHGCIGAKLAKGELTMDQAAALFKNVQDPERRKSAAAAALKSYQDHQASKAANKPSHQAPAGVKPVKKLAMPTRVVHCQSSRSGHGSNLDAPWSLLGMDSKADQHIFGDVAFFPHGVQPVKGTIQLETIEGTGPIALGQGTAVVYVDPGVIIEYPNSLYVPGVKANVASVGQSMSQSNAEVRFGAHRDIIFHNHDGVQLPLTDNYDLVVRPVTADELPGAQPRPTLDVITRGKSAGGPAAKLATPDTAQLWAARLPGLSAERLSKLPSVTADAPNKLANARPEHIADDATLMANAPRLHAPAVSRCSASRRGDRTTTDIIGPFPAAKFTANRYGMVLDDVCHNTVEVGFAPTKDKYPSLLDSYLKRNQGRHGCDFTGGVVYSDNEPVLNSVKVDQVLQQYGMRRENSNPYEPNQNPTERRMRTLQEPMRVMHTRGGAGDEYWEFAMTQAAFIHNRTHHAWGADDDGKTPLERKLGAKPSVASFRPMFCLAFVRIPPALRDGKIAARAERCIHLGKNPNGPGYRFEVLSGPRQGKLITSSQAIFRETQFPLAGTAAVATPVVEPTAAELSVLYPEEDSPSQHNGDGGCSPGGDADDNNEDNDNAHGGDDDGDQGDGDDAQDGHGEDLDDTAQNGSGDDADGDIGSAAAQPSTSTPEQLQAGWGGTAADDDGIHQVQGCPQHQGDLQGRRVRLRRPDRAVRHHPDLRDRHRHDRRPRAAAALRRPSSCS